MRVTTGRKLFRAAVQMLLLSAAPGVLAAQATGTVTGIVTAATGSPLAGATVGIAGTTRGAQTGGDGRFTIMAVPVGSRTVRASFAGYTEATRTVTVAAGQTVTVNIQLQPAVIQLDEVVAIGYGTTRRRDVTGSIASVQGEDAVVKAAPTTAVANALQGRAPGVQVTSNSGAPGAGASVRVRGSNSIAANSEPLYVVDGIPFGQGSQGAASDTQNPLATIDPNNVESIQVLKDASATAIYGARGSNGVILITTRRGQRGGHQIQVESSYGVQTMDTDIEMMNSQEWMTMANEANRNAGIAPRYSQIDIDTAKTYDYLDMILRNAPQMSHSATISGGDEQTRFLLSGDYLDQEGVMLRTNFQRYGVRLNLDRNINSAFRIGTSMSGAQTVRQLGNSENGNFNGGISAAMNFAPNVPPKDENGNWNKFSVTSDNTGNPLANQSEIINPSRATRLLGSAFGEYDLAPGLRLRATLGGNFAFNTDLYYAPRTIQEGGVGGVASRQESLSRELTNEDQITYSRELGPGALDLLAGFSIQKFNSENTNAGSSNFPVDAYEFNNLAAGSESLNVSSSQTEATLLSWLGRINYNLLDRYLLTFTGRRDGSSRFGENNKWAFFPSAAFAWRVVDEGFMQNQGIFSDLKLRLSYGRTGNQAIGSYQSLNQLTTVVLGLGSNPAPVIGIAPTNSAGNPDLQWETTQQVNAGVDLGFFDNRVTLSVDAYQTNTEDLLLSVSLPSVFGQTSQLQNVGTLKNRGLEFALNTINIEGDRFLWRSNLNVSTNANEITSLGETPRIIANSNSVSFLLEPGLPLGSMLAYKVLGLYQQGDECPLTNSTQCEPGEWKVQDTDANGTINDLDRVLMGHGDPQFYGGFNNNLSFGPLTLDAFFNFSYGNTLANISRLRNSLVRGVYGERKEVVNRWTPTNTDATFPRANANRANLLYSTLIEDASFIRLQTLTLGYDVPQRLVPIASETRIYLTGQNLFTWTEYTGFDPEMNRGGGDARFRGIDFGGIPRARVWNVGARFTF